MAVRFLTPAGATELAKRIRAVERPGGLVAVYDGGSGSVVVAAVRIDDGGEPKLESWSVAGPFEPDEAAKEIAEAQARAASGGFPTPLTVN